MEEQMGEQRQKGIMNIYNENYLFKYAKLVGAWLAIKRCESATEQEKNLTFMKLVHNTPFIRHIDATTLKQADNIEFCFGEISVHIKNKIYFIKVEYTEGPLTKRNESGIFTKPARKLNALNIPNFI